MLHLNEVDTRRVNRVLSGELTDRGCGLTIARLVKLFSYVRPENQGKNYLFIGETHEHVHNLCKQFYTWVEDTEFITEIELQNLKITLNLPQKPPSNLWAKILVYFNKPKRVHPIKFNFTTPECVYTVGRRYNKIILDVTNEKYFKNRKRITEAFHADMNE